MNSNWSYSPETKSWVVTSVTLTFDLWPWPFAWTLPWSNVITPENFMMIRWWEHCQKGVTDGQTDRQTDGRTDRRTENTIHRAAWSQLKNSKPNKTSVVSYSAIKKPMMYSHRKGLFMETSCNICKVFMLKWYLCGLKLKIISKWQKCTTCQKNASLNSKINVAIYSFI